MKGRREKSRPPQRSSPKGLQKACPLGRRTKKKKRPGVPKVRKLWLIKPVTRVKPSGKIYKRPARRIYEEEETQVRSAKR